MNLWFFQEFEVYEVDMESEEAKEICDAFHESLNKVHPDIVSIKRVQNASLWNFYQL